MSEDKRITAEYREQGVPLSPDWPADEAAVRDEPY